MYTQSEYLYGWLFYLLGVVLVMGCWWYLTAGIRFRLVRTLLRVLGLIFFLVPWYASSDMDYLAPAWLIAAFEGIVDNDSSFWRAGAPLLSALGVVAVLTIGIALAVQTLRKIRVQKAD